jgi:hypothetical protein
VRDFGLFYKHLSKRGQVDDFDLSRFLFGYALCIVHYHQDPMNPKELSPLHQYPTKKLERI